MTRKWHLWTVVCFSFDFLVHFLLCIHLTLQCLIYSHMKTFNKNVIPILSPPSTISDPTSPTLHDSKSAVNLSQSLQEGKKIRETTFFPATSKNTNRQFLRYTVNLNKSDKEAFTTLVTPTQDWRAPRKFTISDSQKKLEQSTESPVVGSKFSSSNKRYEKKNSNPERKQQNSIKFPLPKFLEKKNVTNQDTSRTNQYKTQRLQATSKPSIPTQKKSFTPKCTKAFQDPSPVGKIASSYSSNDLLKLKYASSPTCESITSRVVNRQKLLNSPCIDHFKKLKFLGEGKFGQVHLVLHKQTNSIFALKQIKKENIIKNKMEEQLLMEIKMQLYFNHPNILKLYGFFNDKDNIYLILEYMEEGTLYSQLRKKKTLTQQEASRKLRDILDGVKHLHSQNIAHRDIKPQNIVISYDVCKICDLGWAAICEDRRKTLCGTIDYASPQILQGKQYGIAIDLWCLGVLCYELTVGKCPFYHISRKETMKKIINADLSDINLPQNLANQTKDFIGKMLRKNPEERMSAEEAIVHPLIFKYYDQDLEDIKSLHRKKQ